MRTLRRSAAFFATVLLGWIAVCGLAHAVGYSHAMVEDPEGQPIEIGIWYPSEAPTSASRLELFEQTVAQGGAVLPGGPLPLVVFSHGTGGSYAGHYDTAIALAQAGYVVAALTHTGDNYRDQSRALAIWDRPRQVSLVIDFMLSRWSGHERLDPARVGAFGFSAGGFTTLALIGGVPDFTLIGGHCRDHPEEWTCHMLAQMAPAAQGRPMTSAVVMKDERVKVAVVAAPALGYTFLPDGLKTVRIPVQLWRAENDHVLPQPFYAEAVRVGLPVPPEYHVVAGADHFDFLVPCSSALAAVAPEICTDPTGFDRVAFHQEFNALVVRFFREHL
jgi:predicted dienelactone hydrolase